MSLFKTRTWWAAGGRERENEEFDRGSLALALLSPSSLSSLSSSPSPPLPVIVTASFEGLIRIYSPQNREFQPADLLLEQNLNLPIIQIETGRFIGSEQGLAVLHPRKLSLYSIKLNEGVGEQGSYCSLERKYEHSLERTAANMTFGPFGGVAGKDFLAVQSMDGLLMVFEQSRAAFTAWLGLGRFLLPGPLCYVARLDAFVTSDQRCHVEAYNYQLLASSSLSSPSPPPSSSSSPSPLSSDSPAASDEAASSSAKRLQVAWSQNVGEPVVDIFVARFSRALTSTQVDIVVLCERSLFCLKESGAIRFQKRFDYPTACCFPYFIGGEDKKQDNNNNQQQPQSQNLIVASHLGSLLIYKDMQLVWASKIGNVPVALKVAKFSNLQGLIVSLDEHGSLEVSYLGTDPASHVVNNPVESKELNYDEMDKELRDLQSVIREASSHSKVEPADKIILRAQEIPLEQTADSSISTCFRLYISYTGMDTLQNINIAISTTSAIKVSQPSFVLDTLAGGNTSRTPTVIPLIFQCKPSTIPNERTALVIAAYTTAKGDARTARLEITLPLSLFCKIVPPIKASTYKLMIDTGRRGVSLSSLFNDLQNIPLDSNSLTSPPDDAPNIISMQYHCGPDVTIVGSKSSGKYRIQSSHFEAMWLILSELTSRLLFNYKTDVEREKEKEKEREKEREKDPATTSPPPSRESFRVSFTDDLPFQEYFALIDAHFQCRKLTDGMKDDLEKLTTQFRAIQKRLLVRYKDRNAVPLANMDMLLGNTFEDISLMSAKIQNQQKATKVAACNLACATQLMQRLVRYKFNLDDTSYLVLQTYLPAKVNDTLADQQGWEESTNASLVQLLRTVLAASAQDMATLPVLSTLNDTNSIKQHMLMVTDRLAKGGKLYKPSSSSPSSSRKKSSSGDKSSPKTRSTKPREKQ